MLRENKGVTLVALVITIIVLLILAAVSISLVVGDNGVMTQAVTAVDNTTVGEAREWIEMCISSAQADFFVDWVADQSLVYFDDASSTKSWGAGEKIQDYLTSDNDYTCDGTSLAGGSQGIIVNPYGTDPDSASASETSSFDYSGITFDFVLVCTENGTGATLSVWEYEESSN